MQVTLTCTEDNHQKFYTLSLQKNVVSAHFGRIGSDGQRKDTTFDSETEAQKQFETLLAQKKKKGYVEQQSNETNGHAKPTKAMKPKIIKEKEELLTPFSLPTLALEDPPVDGLDLSTWLSEPLPIPTPDTSPFESTDLVIEGYTLSFGDDDEIIVNDSKGKKLKTVPAKLRNHEEYQALMRGRKDERSRGRKARRMLEDRMIIGNLFLKEEIHWFTLDRAFAPFLKGILIRSKPNPRDLGILVQWNETRGLGIVPLDYDARWIGWEEVEIMHPIQIESMEPWQDLLVDLGLKQELVQLFRELKSIPKVQLDLTESSMLANRETRSGSAIERSLLEEGWVVRRGTARRVMQTKLSHEQASESAILTKVEAWFDYGGDYYIPFESTTTGSFGFHEILTHKPVSFRKVHPILISETIRSLEVALAQAGATKENEDETSEEQTEEEST